MRVTSKHAPKRLPEGYRRRLLIGLVSVLCFSSFVTVFVLILNIPSTTIQPYIIVNQTGTDEVTAIKSILVPNGKDFKGLNGIEACMTEYTCHKDCSENGR